MPGRPKRACNWPRGCSGYTITNHRYCEPHRRQSAREFVRPDNRQSLYGNKWRKVRAVHLRQNPLCVICEKNGMSVSATEVDHIKRHEGDVDIFWDDNNWQGLCKPCHSRKTMKEVMANKKGEST